MQIISSFVSRLRWYQLLLIVGLTTLAAIIILPYFFGGSDCKEATKAVGSHIQTVITECPSLFVRFYTLWFRLFIVAVVMFFWFLIAETIWHTWAKPAFSLLATQLSAVALGAFFGTIISGLIIGRTLRQMFSVEPMLFGILIFTTVGIGIGAVTAMVLVYRSRAARADADIAQADSTRHALEKQVLEARLKLLQAQIEPHFLFNTLANVQHLTEANPPLASKTLESLITYLRAALPQMREGSTTLGREVAMAIAYLDIQSVRMGARLKYTVDIPKTLNTLSFPPMMLLTLIENAIKHGVDPLPSDGMIHVSASFKDDSFEVSVSDNGLGLTTVNAIGVGLSNIRERLTTLYGKQAKLSIEENTPRGVIAKITIQQLRKS